MSKKIVVTLKFENGDTTEHEVDLVKVQDVGAIYDPLTEKYFIFSKLNGRYFNLPVFEETKVLVLDRGMIPSEHYIYMEYARRAVAEQAYTAHKQEGKPAWHELTDEQRALWINAVNMGVTPSGPMLDML